MTKPKKNDAPTPAVVLDAEATTASLEKLTVHTSNVRDGSEVDGDIDMLVASIMSVGLLQPLVVTPSVDGVNYRVVAGRRRLTALQHIHSGHFEDPLNAPVYDAIPILVIDDEKAIEASLAENYARRQMTSRELYVGMKALADSRPMFGIEEIAAAFGLEKPRAARILRLAELHPPIFEAWTDGKIDDRTAYAYASTPDIAVQQQLWEDPDVRWDGQIKSAIRALIAGEEVDEATIRYVTLDAYKASGGGVVEDLFSDSVTILDAALMIQLRDDKIALERAVTEQELKRADGGPLNIEWVDEPPQINRYDYWSTDYALAIKSPDREPTEAEAERLKEIDEALRASDDGDDEMPEDNYVALEEEAASIESGLKQVGVIPESVGKVLLVGKINHAGDYEVTLWHASYADAGLDAPAQSTTKTKDPTSSKTPGEQLKAEVGSSRDGFMAMQCAVGDTIAAEFVGDQGRGSSLGLHWLIFSLSRELARHGVTNSAAAFAGVRSPERGNIKVRDLTPTNTELDEYRARFDAIDWIKEGDSVAAWDRFKAVVDDDTLAFCGAVVAGRMLSPLASSYREELAPKMVHVLADEVSSGSMVAWAQRIDRGALVDLMSHKARVETLGTFGLRAHAAGLKKGTSGDFLRKVLNADAEQRKLWDIDEETGAAIDAWVPPAVEIRVPAPPPPPKPKAVKAPKPKKAKPAKVTKPEPELVDA